MNRKGVLLFLILAFCMNNVLAAATQVLFASNNPIHHQTVIQASVHLTDHKLPEMPMSDRDRCQNQEHTCATDGQCDNCYLHCAVALPQLLTESSGVLLLSSHSAGDLPDFLLSRTETLYRPPILS